MPIYKDYTIVADYERLKIEYIEDKGTPAILSKSYTAGQGAFIMNLIGSTGGHMNAYTFGNANSAIFNDLSKKIYYQSKYKMQGFDVTIGSGVDGDSLWLGVIRDYDHRFFNGAIYSLMSFPYSMSEFLIERQLKKHKLGTLYQDMVEFRPVITANANYNVFYTALLPLTGTVWEKINIGDYVPVGRRVAIQMSFDNEADELVSAVSSQLDNITIVKNSNNIGYTIFGYVLKDKSPQKINITIDEYIRYEDIVQPYPAKVYIINENEDKIITWGDKLKVGTSLILLNIENLLPEFYDVNSSLTVNGISIYKGQSFTLNENRMVFKLNRRPTYKLDNNEPKCILSPSRLRIPNSSYKILGHIPDISGHGNNGVINNSAYAVMSGANGYLLDFKTFTTGNSSLVNIKDDSIIEVINTNKEKGSTYINLNKYTSTNLSSWKIKVTGMKSGDTIGYYYSGSTDATLRSKFDIKSDGIYSLPSSIANSNNIGGIAFDVVAGADSAYRIEQIGEYEGAYCLDGVDDFVTIPTLSSGGKQVLMKVNWSKNTFNEILYDQRENLDIHTFAIYNYDSDTVTGESVVAYNSKNNGNTYIDGILNYNIKASELKDIEHNITITNELVNTNNSISPIIGTNKNRDAHYAQMSLYDFMLFDEISTDDKIKELNEYVGIEAKVELPPYYWDTYGKTNFDADKTTIQQRGVAIGDYDLTNYNHVYEGMSGYNGYPVVFGANKTWANESNGYVTSITSNTIHITNVLNAGLALLYSYVKYNGNLQNIKEIPPFKIEIKGLEGRSKFIYKYLATSDATKETNLYLGNGTHELPKSFLPTEALINNAAVGFSISPIEEGVTNFLSDITIEVLPKYENGLVYDGIEDYSVNTNIPALTDYTCIVKRERISNELEGFTITKGDKVYAEGNGNAFLMEWDTTQQFSFGGKTVFDVSKIPDLISYITPTSYNGETITKGTGPDTTGLYIAGNSSVTNYSKMVLYKLILYPKTISLLEINFLKNLMEKDEIIDLTNPIFIQ